LQASPSSWRVHDDKAVWRWPRLPPLDPETDECVEYPFGKFSTGYGNVKVNGRSRTAHSVAYELHVGSIPEGYDVCHNCGHRPCVNPQHLRADTHVSNMADKLAHGTHHRGVRNGRARLTESEVISIRESVAAGAVQKDVARQMGVSPQTVNHIVQGRTWNAEVVPSGAASSF
ncbi:MAG TPA: HNH endonuclease, partial [Gemmatimonadaceae bacterium]|nr:HNH endonuclease [Gemmatimonadaceae bacterium]